MEKMSQLTPAQEKSLAEFKEEWMGIGLQTGPADLDALRPAINALYGNAGYGEPYLWHCESPLTAQLIINMLRENLRPMWSNLRENLRENLMTMRDSMWGNLRENLRENLMTMRDSMWSNLGPNLRENLRADLGSDLRNIGDNLGVDLAVNLGTIRANLWVDLRDILGNLEYVPTCLWGSIDAYWIAYYLFPHVHLRPMHTDAEMTALGHWSTIARNAFWWYAFEGICFVCDRPSAIRMEKSAQGILQFHNEEGPAYEFADGWMEYYWRGVHVTEQIVMRPETLTVEQIEAESNAEVRRVMIERHGPDRYMRDSGAKLVQRDEYGVLWQKTMNDDEPLTMVEVVNSTPERDGTRKHYWLRVPPSMTTARQAVAWTFDLTPDDYRPMFES